MPTAQTLFLALLGGILPALLWLWFWLREDRLHPEPRRLIILAFIAGMAVVFLALPAEHYIEKITTSAIAIVVAWSAIEELLKLAGAYFAGLHNKECDEPIDPMIYLITAALGFAAIENALFLISSINENLLSGIITGNLRFIGASLLHVLASGTMGLFMAYGFYKNRFLRTIYLIIGTAVAIALHSLFNYFIINSGGGGTFVVFCFVWVSIVLLLAAFEKVKRIKEVPQL
jgi:RsiW-degrading membrane proteinase PrsW (M82 family)